MLRTPRCGGARLRAHLATLILSLCVVAAVTAPAQAAPATKLPTQGVYDQCDAAVSTDACASRLQRLSQAGFKVVAVMGLTPRIENLTAVQAYATAAQANGMKVMWSVRPGISDAELLAVIAALRVLPSTWGYYISDEPGPTEGDKLRSFSARVKALDPGHQQLIMGCGICYGGESSVSFLSGMDTALGTDMYPVATQAPDQPVVGRRVRAAAEGLRRVADREGRQTVVALQAWRWGDSHYDSQATGIGPGSRFPTRREIEDQRNAAIEGGNPDIILWFIANQFMGWEPGQHPWWWAKPNDLAQRWSNVVGGAFAPLPSAAKVTNKRNKRPVARFSLRTRTVKRTLRVALNGKKSYDPDGRITRYRWYASGAKKAVCAKRRCTIKLRGGRRKVALRLVVSDRDGARGWRTRWVTRRRG